MTETVTSAPLRLRLNPAAAARRVPLGDGAHCLVLDDFLEDAPSVRAWAAGHASGFEAQEGAYPGSVLPLAGAAAEPLAGFVRRRLSREFGFLRGDLDLQVQFSLTTRDPADFSWIQRLPHTDPRLGPERRNYATVLYLFDDEALGGTAFFRWRDPGFWPEFSRRAAADLEAAEAELRERFALFREPPRYPAGSDDVVEELARVPARFNRLVAYSGEIPHSAFVPAPDRLTDDVVSGRLTLNGFASVRTRP